MVKPKAKKTSAVSATEGAQATKSGTVENPSLHADVFASGAAERNGDSLPANDSSKPPVPVTASRTPPSQNFLSARILAPGTAGSGLEVADKIKELVRLAQEQGYLTYSDINDALPDTIVTPEELDEIYIKLRNLEVEIVDQAEVDRVKQPGTERGRGEEPAGHSGRSGPDVSQADGPGAAADARAGSGDFQAHRRRGKRRSNASFTASASPARSTSPLAEKLLSEPPKERFDRVIVDKKIESRESHLRRTAPADQAASALLDQQVDEKYAAWQGAAAKSARRKASTRDFKKLDQKLQQTFPKFYYKQKVIEEMALVAENIHDKIQLSLRADRGAEKQQQQVPAAAGHHRIRTAQDQGAGGIRAHALPRNT